MRSKNVPDVDADRCDDSGGSNTCNTSHQSQDTTYELWVSHIIKCINGCKGKWTHFDQSGNQHSERRKIDDFTC